MWFAHILDPQARKSVSAVSRSRELEILAGLAPAWMIIAALVAGALLASFPPAEQDAVEGSLVLAGITPYPPESAMGRYYFGVWTLLHQVGAAMIWLGVPQEVLEYVFALSPMALRCGGYAMLIFGFSHRPGFSLLGAAFCTASGFLLPFFSAPEYPVGGRLGVPVQYTFGIFGYAMAAWIFGAVAGGRTILAGFSTVVLISIHPVMGAYVTAALVAAMVIDRALQLGMPTQGLLRGLSLGAPITMLSLAIFIEMRPHAGPVDVDLYAAYMTYWDGHRATPFEPFMLVTVAIAIVALVAFIALARRTCSSALLASVVLLVCVGMSGTLYAAVHLVPDLLPRIVVAAMPGRMLSVHATVAGAMAIGLAAWLLNWMPALWTSRLDQPGARNLLARTIAPVNWVLRGALLCIALMAPGQLERDLRVAYDAFVNQRYRIGRTDDFWSQVRAAKIAGPVLTSYHASIPALHKGHLQSLLNTTAINFIPYVPSAVGDVAQIITDAYGVSFTHPPDRVREVIMDEQPYWSRLDIDQWAALNRKFGIVAVVCPSAWKLKLRPTIAGPQYTLYRIAP